MSRIGKKVLLIPNGVDILIKEKTIVIKGQKGELSHNFKDSVSFFFEKNQLFVNRYDEKKETKAYHGLIRSLIYNMILGVTETFSKTLILEGVGYKFQLDKNILFLNIGFSHQIFFQIPSTINLKIESPTRLQISGIDKAEVGLFAAKIRDIKPPEPYKGKGIKYENEKILRKTGKTRK